MRRSAYPGEPAGMRFWSYATPGGGAAVGVPVPLAAGAEADGALGAGAEATDTEGGWLGWSAGALTGRGRLTRNPPTPATTTNAATAAHAVRRLRRRCRARC